MARAIIPFPVRFAKNQHGSTSERMIPQTLVISGYHVALDPDTKLVPSFVVGKRSSENTQAFMRDLRSRIADHRIQLTTDAYIFCRKAVEAAFGGDADFAPLTSCMAITASLGMRGTTH